MVQTGCCWNRALATTLEKESMSPRLTTALTGAWIRQKKKNTPVITCHIFKHHNVYFLYINIYDFEMKGWSSPASHTIDTSL